MTRLTGGGQAGAGHFLERSTLTPAQRTFTCNGPRDGDGSTKHASLGAHRGVGGRLSLACLLMPRAP